MRKMKKVLVGVIATSCILGAGLSASAEELAVTVKEEQSVKEVITPFYNPLEVRIEQRNAQGKGTSYKENRKLLWNAGALNVYHAVWNDGFYDRPFNNQRNYGISVATTYTISSNQPDYTWDNTLTVTNSSEVVSDYGTFTLKR